MGELPAIIQGALTPEFRQQAELVNQYMFDAIQARSPWFDANAAMADPDVQKRYKGLLFGVQLTARIPQRYCAISYEHLYGEFVSEEPVFYGSVYGNRTLSVGLNLTEFDTAVNWDIRSRDAIAIALARQGLMVGIKDDFKYAEPEEGRMRIGKVASLEVRWGFEQPSAS
jgi:hypothetical protein